MRGAEAKVYVVKPGDSLPRIAQVTGKSVAELARLNGVEDPDRLEAGRALYLSGQEAFAFQVLFVDALRHPIENLRYELGFDGRVVSGKTGRNGLTETIITAQGHSEVEVCIQDPFGQWQRLGSFVSGYGRKLVTCVSHMIVFKDKLEPHPPGAPLGPSARKPPAPADAGAKPPLPKTPQGKPSKNNPNVKLNKTKGEKGESIIQIGIDLPQELLAYMQAYEERKITEDEWKKFAKYLECEINVLKAIAKVESGGRSAFWTINDKAQIKAHAPKIVFERHVFHRLTQGMHDKDHPDISWPSPYLRRKDHPIGSVHHSLHDQRVDGDDLYDNRQDYLRLINAYRLDKEAALKAASWGMFQILGANYAICGADDVNQFVKAMCRNEAGQIELLAKFIRNKKDRKSRNDPWQTLLWEAVKQKDWANIARYYNGPGYKTFNYDQQLKAAYEAYCKKTG